MDKVKAIFKSDSNDSTTGTGSAGVPSTHDRSSLDRTSQSGTLSNSTGTGVSSGATHGVGSTGHQGGLTGSHGTTGQQTGGLAGAAGQIAHETRGTEANHRTHTEGASLPGHQHNIKEHHELPGEGVGQQTHDHKHLAAVTKEKHHEHEVEEVERHRTHEKHVHHVQHHVQPLKDEQHASTVHRDNVVPETHIREQHVSTEEDRGLLSKLTSQHRDTQVEGTKDRQIVDRGETVTENVSHHVHHLVQPVIERDTHHHSTIHTSIPIHHTTHEAPIIHQSSTHEPMALKDFVSQGGDLKSKLTHQDAGVLANGECERAVDGPAETLAEKLHLGSSHKNTTSSTGSTGLPGQHTGTTGQHTGVAGQQSGLTGNTGTTGTTSNRI